MTTDVLLNKFFTVNSLNKFIKNNNIDLYKKVTKLFLNDDKVDTNLDAIKKMYSYMSKKHRNEYFYKNTLINKILLGKHSVRTSTAIRELPINNNILDLLIINGIGQVYEIKTGLDNLNRLNSQLEAYYTVFSYCNVVTDVTHLQEIKDRLDGTPTGIIVLTQRGTLHVEKKAINCDDYLNSKAIFNVLRKYEFENILKKVYGYLPQTTQSKYYDACFNLFEQIEVKRAQNIMLKELKKRSSINESNYQNFQSIPKEIKSLVYFSDYKDKEFDSLNRFLNMKY